MNYEELDFQQTPLGELDIYEVKVGEHFLMSSLFHEAETQLSRLGLGVLSHSWSWSFCKE